MPADVLGHPDLIPSAKLMFAALALEGRGEAWVRVGCRRLAKLAGLKKSQAAAAIMALVEAGLLEVERATRGRGHTYLIRHKQFGWEAPKKKACPRCKRDGFTLGASGVCAACVGEL